MANPLPPHTVELEVAAHCETCDQWREFIFVPGTVYCCPECKKDFTSFVTDEISQGNLNQCLVCGSPHLFKQKDFNRTLGIGLIVLGVGLAYWTYGISLVVVTLIDAFLYRMVGMVGSCYRCESQFRGTHSDKIIEALEPFNLSLHDYYRNLGEDKHDHHH